MRNHKLLRLFVNQPLQIGKVVELDKSQSHYISTVMRRKIADLLLLFNGIDGEFVGEITSLTRNKVEVEVKKIVREQRNSPSLALVFSPVKNVKTEYIVQKATEMGVAEIFPVQMERTIVKLKSGVERLEAVAIEASEQCERMEIPKINEFEKLSKILDELKNYKILLCDETGQGGVASEVLPQFKGGDKKWAVIIGPEGGFSKSELEMIYARENVVGVGLGLRILRADTAIIAALTTWQIFLGDFDSAPDFRDDLGN